MHSAFHLELAGYGPLSLHPMLKGIQAAINSYDFDGYSGICLAVTRNDLQRYYPEPTVAQYHHTLTAHWSLMAYLRRVATAINPDNSGVYWWSQSDRYIRDRFMRAAMIAITRRLGVMDATP